VELNSIADALSGLQANQTYMDVVGNNISNVNTTAYKTQNIHFEDLLNQTVSYGNAKSGTLQGVDPTQVGMGVGQGMVNIVNAQGSVQDTGRPTDMSIQGSGYFVLNDGKQNYYTRDGAFGVSPDGTLSSGANGMKVQGWQADNTGAVDATKTPTDIAIPLTKDPKNPASAALKGFSVGRDGSIIGAYDDGTSQTIARVALTDFRNPDGLIRNGGNLYSAGVNAGQAQFPTTAGGTTTTPYAAGGTGTLGAIGAGQLEGSNVDLAKQFADMIQAQQGFNANTKVITTTNNMIQSVLSIVP